MVDNKNSMVYIYSRRTGGGYKHEEMDESASFTDPGFSDWKCSCL